MEDWKVCVHTCVFVTTCAHQHQQSKRIHMYLLSLLIPFRGVNADIRVRIDGVEENHGIIKVDKDGKVRKTRCAFI